MLKAGQGQDLIEKRAQRSLIKVWSRREPLWGKEL